MTYIIAEPCIDIKDRSCVGVCPTRPVADARSVPRFARMPRG